MRPDERRLGCLPFPNTSSRSKHRHSAHLSALDSSQKTLILTAEADEPRGAPETVSIVNGAVGDPAGLITRRSTPSARHAWEATNHAAAVIAGNHYQALRRAPPVFTSSALLIVHSRPRVFINWPSCSAHPPNLPVISSSSIATAIDCAVSTSATALPATNPTYLLAARSGLGGEKDRISPPSEGGRGRRGADRRVSCASCVSTGAESCDPCRPDLLLSVEVAVRFS